jgi:ankyrin repeat protein
VRLTNLAVLLANATLRSPLQFALQLRNMDMTRLLIGYDADGDHLSHHGRTAIFYLWLDQELKQQADSNMDKDKAKYMDLLRVLDQTSLFLDLEVIDNWGWTILQRRAAHGTGEEVRQLLHLGCSPRGQDLSIIVPGETAIQYAITHGNYDTFEALLPSYGDLDQADRYGWRLISLAAYCNEDKMVRRLLELGADEFIPGRDSDEALPDLSLNLPDMVNHPDELPPWNKKAYDDYMKALADFGRIQIVSESQAGITEEYIFWEVD